jgi:hypothetical protein
MAGDNRRNWLLGIGFVIAILALSSCYPKRVGPVGISGERLAWMKMSVDQKKTHMEAVVLPRAAQVFRTWRPDRYPRIDCTLCHGPDPVAVNFRMPSLHLPRLSGEVLLGPEFAKYPETTRLKLDSLVPAMSEALGLKSFSVITRRGFGCYSCHLGPGGPMFGH